jgi:hypothetical protein
MQNKINRIILGVLVLATLFRLSANAQVTNGDFSSSTNGWSYFFPASNHLIPSYGIMQVDIDGSGPLSNSPAFYANVGEDALMDLQQNVYLVGGVTYLFHADLSSIPYSFNIDGGTVSVFIGASNISFYSFGSFSSISPKYSSLSTNFSPATSGTQTLSINFSRGYGYGGVGNTPTDVIDNISLSPVHIPLQFQSVGNAVIFSWTNAAYALQAAPSASGPYTNISGAASPFTNSLSGPANFFRLMAN